MHRDELWQTYSANGEPVIGGYPAKLDNPPFGPGNFVGVCCVWLYRQTKNGFEVLFQKRSKFVDRSPEKWDVSAGGHIDYCEVPTDAALRETLEEIGVEIEREKLQLISTDVSTERVNRIRYVYCYDWGDRADDFHFDDQEVSEVKWVPFSEFDAFIDKNAKPALKTDHLIREIIKRFLNARGNHQA